MINYKARGLQGRVTEVLVSYKWETDWAGHPAGCVSVAELQRRLDSQLREGFSANAGRRREWMGPWGPQSGHWRGIKGNPHETATPPLLVSRPIPGTNFQRDSTREVCHSLRKEMDHSAKSCCKADRYLGNILGSGSWELMEWVAGRRGRVVDSSLREEHSPMTQDLVPWREHPKPSLIHCWHGSLKVGNKNGLPYMRWKCQNCLGRVLKKRTKGSEKYSCRNEFTMLN